MIGVRYLLRDEEEVRRAELSRLATARSSGSRARPALAVVPLPERCGLRLIGEVDLTTRPRLAAALDSMAGGREDLHLDLSELHFIDVAGAALLVSAAMRTRGRRRVVLHRPSLELRRTIGLLWGYPPALEVRP